MHFSAVGDMTESKSSIFNTSFPRIHPSHDLDVRLFRDTFLAVTEPNLDERFGNQLRVQVCAAEPPHRVPSCTFAFDGPHPACAVRIYPTFRRSQPNRLQNRVEPIAVDIPLQ